MTRETVRAADAVEGGIGLYSRAAHASSANVIREYSTSFGMATRLLSPEVRTHIENVYALVRIADEVVDGAAEQAGVDSAGRRRLLDALEADVETACTDRFSTNLVVHSFAVTARAAGIDHELTGPFFESMRRDLDVVEFTSSQLREYVYGSAEVIGVMCLRVFMIEQMCEPIELARLEDGARRLGAAFQKINFLRDLAVDLTELGRSYFPGVGTSPLTETRKIELVDEIDKDLECAAAAIPHLPTSSRRAVSAAYSLFAELARRLRRTPAETIARRRVRVPAGAKAALLARAALGHAPGTIE